jgi:type VI secretion system protein ImpE
MDTAQALKDGRLGDALASVKEAVRAAPADARHRSLLFQLYCVQGNWEGAATQLKLVADLDVEAALWVGVCEKLLACEAERRAVFAGQKPPTLFGQPPEWVGGLVEAFRLGLQGNWRAAAASQAQALEAAPATAAEFNGQEVAWVADADSRFGPIFEAFIEGKYYWIPCEHIRALHMRSRTHLMDSVWAPVDFEWLNEGQAAGYIPVRYPGSESSADPQIQLGRQTEWHEETAGFFRGLGHRILATDAAEFGLAEVKSIHFSPAANWDTPPPAGDADSVDEPMPTAGDAV